VEGRERVRAIRIEVLGVAWRGVWNSLGTSERLLRQGLHVVEQIDVATGRRAFDRCDHSCSNHGSWNRSILACAADERELQCFRESKADALTGALLGARAHQEAGLEDVNGMEGQRCDCLFELAFRAEIESS
jgi:hypothetical protein